VPVFAKVKKIIPQALMKKSTCLLIEQRAGLVETGRLRIGKALQSCKRNAKFLGIEVV
jgi:hypothetical protein